MPRLEHLRPEESQPLAQCNLDLLNERLRPTHSLSLSKILTLTARMGNLARNSS